MLFMKTSIVQTYAQVCARRKFVMWNITFKVNCIVSIENVTSNYNGKISFVLNLPRMNTGSQLSLMPCNVVKLYFPNNRLVSSSIWKGNIHNSGPFIAELKGYFILEWLVSGHSDLTLQSGSLQRDTGATWCKTVIWPQSVEERGLIKEHTSRSGIYFQ